MAIRRSLTLFATLLAAACSSSSSTPTADAGKPLHDGGSSAADTRTPVDSASTKDSAPTKDSASPTDTAPPTDTASPVDSTPPAESGPVEASTQCQLPTGPYGIAVGDTMDPTLTWQAYAPGSTTPTTLKLSDLYDCDGSKGINAIVLDTSAQWCIACQGEAQSIPTWLGATGQGAGNWTALGVQFVTLMIQTNLTEPATITTAEQWRTLYGLTGIWVAADPGVTFENTNALPMNMLVDPRTLKITYNLGDYPWPSGQGYYVEEAGVIDGAWPTVAQLASSNKRDN